VTKTTVLSGGDTVAKDDFSVQRGVNQELGVK